MKHLRIGTALAVVLVLGTFTTGNAYSSSAAQAAQDEALRAVMASMNAQLGAQGADYRVDVVEWMTAPGGEVTGNTVFFNNRGNKQLGSHFVPGHPFTPGQFFVPYIVDLADGATTSGLGAATTQAAIDRAMGTWDGQNCSMIPIANLGDPGFDIGIVQSILGFGGDPSLFLAGGIMHAGWLPRGFFDLLAPSGGDFILGATFTFIWVGGDSNNDGKSDTAFREIYYNDNFGWAIDSDFDVETVALHEAGHGLSQGHFGKLFRTDKNGKFHFAPTAVMNAGYTGVQQSPRGTDNSGHCSIWGSWPNQ